MPHIVFCVPTHPHSLFPIFLIIFSPPQFHHICAPNYFPISFLVPCIIVHITCSTLLFQRNRIPILMLPSSFMSHERVLSRNSMGLFYTPTCYTSMLLHAPVCLHRYLRLVSRVYTSGQFLTVSPIPLIL